MDYLQIRLELKKLGKRTLFQLVLGQKISRCLIKKGNCPLLFKYKKLNFCLSEILGKSCQEERLKKFERFYHIYDEYHFFLPLKFREDPNERRIESLFLQKNAFNVYYRENSSTPILFLGKVIERRKEERGNNLKDLLNKARLEFADRVKDPSLIFLLGT
ncbi:MAG: hypothetical protein ABIM43_07820 [candidate division WOR-3 bacterium]